MVYSRVDIGSGMRRVTSGSMRRFEGGDVSDHVDPPIGRDRPDLTILLDGGSTIFLGTTLGAELGGPHKESGREIETSGFTGGEHTETRVSVDGANFARRSGPTSFVTTITRPSSRRRHNLRVRMYNGRM